MNIYHVFSAATVNYLWLIKLISLGLKKYKKADTKYVYHVMLDTDDLSNYKKSLQYLTSDDFQIDLISSNIINDKLSDSVKNSRIKMTYARCLLHLILPNVDKCLYLDADMLVMNNGVEYLFEEDMSNKCLMACYDIPTQLMNIHNEKGNCKTETYFNAGMLLFNLKKIREDGIGRQLEQDCLSWPKGLNSILHDQTLLNYRIKTDDVLFLHPTFNNMLYGSDANNVPSYQVVFKNLKWCERPEDSFDQTIIAHFTNVDKPWNDARPNVDYALPFRRRAQFDMLKKIKELLND